MEPEWPDSQTLLLVCFGLPETLTQSRFEPLGAGNEEGRGSGHSALPGPAQPSLPEEGQAWRMILKGSLGERAESHVAKIAQVTENDGKLRLHFPSAGFTCMCSHNWLGCLRPNCT